MADESDEQKLDRSLDEQRSNIYCLRSERYQDYVDTYKDHWPVYLRRYGEFVMELDVEDDLTLISYPNMNGQSGYFVYRAVEYIQWKKNKCSVEKELYVITVVIDYDKSDIYIFDYLGLNTRMVECMKDVFPKNFTIKNNTEFITDGLDLYLGEVWSSLFAEKICRVYWDDKNPQLIVDEWISMELRERKSMIKKQLLEQPKFDGSIKMID